MNLNPEFQRQLYLEFSQARLIGVPMILGIIFAFTYVVDDNQFAAVTTQSALGLFILIVSFWGSRQVVDSVLEELRSHTWDTQRLSALDPWTMVCGKLFGSTLVVWYGGVICLIVYALATPNIANFFWVCSFSVTSGMLVHSISLLLGLVALRKWQLNSNSFAIGLAIFAAITLGTWIMPLAEAPKAIETVANASWYGMEAPVQFLTLTSVSVALFWCVVGNYRLMAHELSIRTVPWVWLVFAVFLIFYVGGFISADEFDNYFYASSFGICLMLSYLAAFSEPHEAMRIKRLFTYIAEENWQRSAEELPIWCITFVLAAFLAIPLSFTDLSGFDDKLNIYPVSILLLMLRDIGIYLYFSYGKNPQRAFSMTLLTLIFLYGVFPGIFTAAEQQWLVAVFFPLTAPNIGLSLVYSVVQNLLVWYLMYQHWRESV